jgi:cysteine-rich repeat protein
MTRTSTTTRPIATAFVLLALASAAFGCQGVDTTKQATGAEPVGKLGMNLTLPDGSTLNTVSYAITGNGITEIDGTIPVATAGATISAAISGIPVGTHYHVTLTGTTTDGKKTCLGDSFFDIFAGATTQVTIALQCTAQTTDGTVVVNTTLNQCPTLTGFTVQPLSQAVNGTIPVTSSATDPENNAIKFTWSDSGSLGMFAAVNSANTTFTCNLKGTTTITVSADDGHGCSDTASIPVTCTSAAVCGNSMVEPGEQCDDGNTVNTDACVACRTAKCGDGFTQTGVEACDDGNTVPGDGCENNCTLTPGCGNGVKEGTEQCDDGNKVACDGCSATCKTEGCGNGVVECAEVCDGTLTATGTLSLGTSCDPTTCKTITDNCKACESAAGHCTNYLNSGIDLVKGCYNATAPADVQLCVDVLNCARTNNCAYGSRGPELCYCGTLDSASCSAAGAVVTGACKTKFEAAAKSTDPVVVTTDFGDTTLPIGNAVFMLKCDLKYCQTTDARTSCVPPAASH